MLQVIASLLKYWKQSYHSDISIKWQNNQCKEHDHRGTSKLKRRQSRRSIVSIARSGLRLEKEWYGSTPAVFSTNVKQDAQLSQRDRAAGCVTVFAKSRRLELGDDILRTL